MGKIVIATIGSLGDLHPFIAVGQVLKARGHDPVLAVPRGYVDKVERAGLKAEPIFPSFEELGAMLGMSEEEATGRMLRDPDFLFRRLLLHYLEDTTARLDAVSEGASAIIATMFAMAAPIVAEKRKLPLIPAVLQPMIMMSSHDPPRAPEFWMMARLPAGAAKMPPVKLAWNRMEMAIVRTEVRRRYGARVNRVRRAHGLGSATRAPAFETPSADAPLVLCLWSEVLGPRQPDYPANARITGFPVFDSDSGGAETLDPELEAFLAAGEPPIVFTLGSFAVYAPGDFYGASAAIARKLNRRAILLTGPGAQPPSAPGVIARAYAPHSLIFPRAALIVHHGGVGTTGQALRAGKPQLIVPYMGDQYEHGDRVARHGAGAVIHPRRYPREGEAIAARLLSDPAIARRANEIAVNVRAERGAETAADAIELALRP